MHCSVETEGPLVYLVELTLFLCWAKWIKSALSNPIFVRSILMLSTHQLPSMKFLGWMN